MEKYCIDYVLGNEPLKKRKKNSKLLTFTPRTLTNREQTIRVKQLEEINRNVMQAHKASGLTVQTCAYPLAIAYMNGDTRAGKKAQFNQYCKNNLVHVLIHFHLLFRTCAWLPISCAMFICPRLQRCHLFRILWLPMDSFTDKLHRESSFCSLRLWQAKLFASSSKYHSRKKG